MKLCSLVITLLFVTISSYRHSHHHALFKNPKAFVAALDKIDTKSIEEMKVMLNDLIADGEKERAAVVQRRDDGQADLNTKEAARTAAVEAETAALTVLEEGQGALTRLKGEEVEAETLNKADVETTGKAKVDRDEQKTNMDSQNIRIDSEKETLLSVAELIKDIETKTLAEMKKGRNLLSAIDYKSMADADPDSIQEVVDLINELVAQGETERAGYIATWNDAVKAYNDAKTISDASFIDWEIALGKVDRQTTDNEGFTEVHGNAVATQKAATKEAEEATSELQRREDYLTEENARLDGEKKTCEEVLDLLDSLLVEGSGTD